MANPQEALIEGIHITPLTARVGAEISGVTLSGDLSGETFARINEALLRHKVIFFRGQHHLDDAAHEAFTRRFGTLVPHPTQGSAPGTNAVLNLDASHNGRADQWHTDVTFVDAYPKISVLRGVVIPETGGDTIWSNTHAAYLDLPEPLRILADSLWALHSNVYDYAAQRPRASEAEQKYYQEVFASKTYQTEHPVVHVHPETGERSLILGSFVQNLIGLPRADSQRLIDIFQSYVTAPQNTVRWRWQQGDVAIWDNRATQHVAVNDYGSQARIVRRVTVDGIVPVGVDGRKSFARISGAAPRAAA